MISIQKLLGKEDKFFDLLEASAEQAHASVEYLNKYLKSPENLTKLDEFIALRRKDKAITNEISDALCTSFVTTLEREDIETLATALYKIPKTVEKIAERLMLAPHFFQGVDVKGHMDLLHKATDTLLSMIRLLRKGAHVEKMKLLNDNLQTIEGEADKLLLNHLRNLYVKPGEAVKAVFLKDIFELLEKVFDRSRDAGNVINHIVLKNS